MNEHESIDQRFYCRIHIPYITENASMDCSKLTNPSTDIGTAAGAHWWNNVVQPLMCRVSNLSWAASRDWFPAAERAYTAGMQANKLAVQPEVSSCFLSAKECDMGIVWAIRENPFRGGMASNKWHLAPITNNVTQADAAKVNSWVASMDVSSISANPWLVAQMGAASGPLPSSALVQTTNTTSPTTAKTAKVKNVPWWVITLLVLAGVSIVLAGLGLIYNNVKYWPSTFQKSQAAKLSLYERKHYLTDNERRVQMQAVKNARDRMKLMQL